MSFVSKNRDLFTEALIKVVQNTQAPNDVFTRHTLMIALNNVLPSIKRMTTNDVSQLLKIQKKFYIYKRTSTDTVEYIFRPSRMCNW